MFVKVLKEHMELLLSQWGLITIRQNKSNKRFDDCYVKQLTTPSQNKYFAKYEQQFRLNKKYHASKSYFNFIFCR